MIHGEALDLGKTKGNRSLSIGGQMLLGTNHFVIRTEEHDISNRISDILQIST